MVLAMRTKSKDTNPDYGLVSGYMRGAPSLYIHTQMAYNRLPRSLCFKERSGAIELAIYFMLGTVAA